MFLIQVIEGQEIDGFKLISAVTSSEGMYNNNKNNMVYTNKFEADNLDSTK